MHPLRLSLSKLLRAGLGALALLGSALHAVPPGTLFVSGSNDQGQLGLGHLGVVYPAKQILTGVKQTADASKYTLIVKTDGTLWAVGENTYGQLGDGTTTNRYWPVQIATGVAKAIVSNSQNNTGTSYFLKTDGTLWGMGYNGHGQLGKGDTSNTLTPVQIASNVKDAASGGGITLFFVKNDNTAWACGYNGWGQYGYGSTTASTVPVQVMTGVASVAASYYSAFFVKTDGTAWAAGYNGYGQLGTGDTTSRATATQVATNVRSVSAAEYSVYFVKNDNSLYAAGGNWYYNFGNGTTTGSQSPLLVATGVSSVNVSAAGAAAVKTDNTLIVAGYNQSYLLGITDNNTYAQTWTNTATGVASVSLGYNSSHYVKTDGTLWAVGDDTYSQLGDGYAKQISTFAAVDDSVTQVAAQPSHLYYVKDDHTLWGAGANGSGQLGLGDQIGRGVFTQSATSVDKVFAGHSNYLAFFRKLDATLWAMGYNYQGMMGKGALAQTVFKSPIQVGSDFLEVVTGDYHTLFLKSDGTVWTSGYGYNGQLGIGSYTQVFERQLAVSNATRIAAGPRTSYALRSDGTLFGFGENSNYQFGFTSPTTVYEPTQVASDVVDALIGSNWSVFLKSDGTLWGAGGNSNRQFGITTGLVSTPTQIATNVTQMAASTNELYIRKTDGSVWAAGANSYGQFGDGTINPSYTFKKIVDNAALIRSSGYFFAYVSAPAFGILDQPRSATVQAGWTTKLRVVAAGTGLTYQWQKGTRNYTGGHAWPEATGYTVSWANVGGGTQALLAVTSIDASKEGDYRVVVSDGSHSETSEVATVLIGAAGPAITAQPADITVTEGDSASFSFTASGSGNTYQWLRRTGTDVTPYEISGATANAYTRSAVTWDDRGDYWARVSNANGTLFTNKAKLTVNLKPPQITTQPQDQTVDANAYVYINIAATGTNLSYQWYKGDVGSGTVVPVRTTGNYYYGESSNSLRFNLIEPDKAGKYYCVVTNTGGSVSTNAMTLAIRTVPVVTAEPASVNANPNASVSFTANASGQPEPTVQWQQSNDGSSGWTDISGATNKTYSFTAPASGADKYYRAVFTNTLGTAATSGARLHLNIAPAIVTQPLDIAGRVGDQVELFAVASGDPYPTNVVWERSADGINWTNYTNSASGTYLASGYKSTAYHYVAAGEDGLKIRATFTNSAGTATTSTATLRILTAPSVTTQPTAIGANPGTSVTFSAAASGNPTPTVQWQRSPDGSTWTDIPGANGTSYTFTAATPDNGRQFRAVFTNTYGNATTNAATLTVYAVPQVTTQPNDVTASTGATISFVAAASGVPTPSVSWERSTDGGATWSAFGGSNATLTVTVAANDNGRQFRAVFTNVAGTTRSNAATLSVPTAPQITTQPASVATTVGSTASFSAAASGVPTPTVKWQRSNDNGSTWTDIPSATSAAYAFVTTSGDNGARFRAVFTNSEGVRNTDAATLSLTAAPMITTSPVSLAVTVGNTATFSAAASGLPAPTVQWQQSTDGGNTFANIPGATSTSYSLTTVIGDNGKRLRAVFTNSVSSVPSSAATLTVNPLPTPTPSPTPLPTATPTPKPTATPTPSPSPTPVPTATPTPSPSPTPLPTATPTPKPTATPSPTATPTPTPTPTSTPTPTPTATPSPSPSPTPLPTATPTPKPTATPSPTATPTPIPTSTPTPTPTATPIPTSTPTPSPTATPKPTATPTPVPAIAPKVTTQPMMAIVNAGTSATFNAGASGTPAPTVQWQQSTDNGATWTNVPGGSSPTLVLPSTSSAMNGYRYRAVFTNTGGQAITVAALLSVKVP
ncbi:immunoglobulin domain-containing protein [Nibricoccus sp. IMCC34717]|uniref:RCC1 domain-containing protein n=1 Tax=Nibricoccus sp. IMCC34717 TaxID=3034021 RepID=UPI00384C66D2